MKYRTNLTAERLREILNYDPLTGEFRWLVKAARCIQVGQIAGSLHRNGYRRICVDNGLYFAHRLAFLYMTGEFPDLDVDHADGNSGNNIWSNLREARESENCANARRPRNNTSGFKGVSWNTTTRKWSASIGINGRKFWLGLFNTPEAAHAAYMAAAIKHWGEFACDGFLTRVLAPNSTLERAGTNGDSLKRVFRPSER